MRYSSRLYLGQDIYFFTVKFSIEVGDQVSANTTTQEHSSTLWGFFFQILILLVTISTFNNLITFPGKLF